MINFGNLMPSNISLGNTPIVEITLGNTRVWPVSTEATVSPTMFSFESGLTTGRTLYITDTYNHGWTLTGGGGWASASSYVGTGSTTVRITVPSNPSTSTRETYFTFTDRNTSNTTFITVQQAAAPAAQSLIFAINPGTYTVLANNAYEIDWTLGWDRDLIDVIDSGVIAQPMYYGDVIQWGTTNYTETIPSSQFGTTKRVFYELVVLDIDGNLITQQTGNADVTIPSNPPASQQYVYLNLPSL